MTDTFSMKLTVGTTAVRLPVEGSGTPLVQNLGPDVLYMDNDAGVTAATGLQIPPGSTYEFYRDLSSGGGHLHLVSVGTSDVRYMVVG